MLLPIAYPIKTPRLYFFDKNGKPLIGGKIKTFKAGSKSDFAKTYRDTYRNASNQKTVKLDNAGSAFLYIFDAQRIEIYDKTDQFIERKFLPQTEYYTLFYDRYGKPLAHGKVYTYDIASTIKKSSYEDAEQTISNPNPIILDEKGGATICVAGSYRLRSYDSKNVFITDQDYKQENRFVLTSKVYAIDQSEGITSNFDVADASQRMIMNSSMLKDDLNSSFALKHATVRNAINEYAQEPQNVQSSFALTSVIQREALNKINVSEAMKSAFTMLSSEQKTVLINYKQEPQSASSKFALLGAQITN